MAAARIDVEIRGDASKFVEAADAARAAAEALGDVVLGEPGDVAQALVAVSLELKAMTLAIVSASSSGSRAPAEPTWCRVELFGHTIRYARVDEVQFAGKTFLELVEPEISGTVRTSSTYIGNELVYETEERTFPEHRRRVSPSAIYAIEEIGEEEVVRTLRRQRGLDLPSAVEIAHDALEARVDEHDEELGF